MWTTIVRQDEAVKRLKERDGLTEEQIMGRIKSQPRNKDYVEASNVVFCSLWSVDYTHQQVDKAWKGLQERISAS